MLDAVLGTGPQSVLAVGSGADPLEQWKAQGYTVVRLDIDPRTEPDIVGSMTDMGDIGPFDAVYSSHSLEHLYPHEVPRALSEFHRVLRTGGAAVVIVPDLQDVPATDEVLPNAYGLTGLHLYYGASELIEQYPHMAHHSGFVESTLRSAMEKAGFEVNTQRMSSFNLMAIGIKK